MTDQDVDLLRSVCFVLDEIPSDAAVSEYEPQPDVASAQESIFLAAKFLDISQDAFDLLKNSDVLETVMGAWISADAISYDTVGAQLMSSVSSWLEDPTPTNFLYWNGAFSYAIYKVQEPKACGRFFDEHGE